MSNIIVRQMDFLHGATRETDRRDHGVERENHVEQRDLEQNCTLFHGITLFNPLASLVTTARAQPGAMLPLYYSL